MRDFHVIAESTIHRGRRLLVSDQGKGYIQLDRDSLPIALPEKDFARFRAMHHYRPVQSMAPVKRSEPAQAVLSR